MNVEAWIVMKAKRGYGVYGSNSPYHGQPRITGARIVKSTANKPALSDDEIAFKIVIDVDESWFLEGTSTIKATVPKQPTEQVIDAQVDLPVKGRAKSSAAGVVNHS